MPQSVKTRCTKKVTLWREYHSGLVRHKHDVRDYAADYTAYVDAGFNGDDLAVRKQWLETSERLLRESRRRYSDHLGQHGC